MTRTLDAEDAARDLVPETRSVTTMSRDKSGGASSSDGSPKVIMQQGCTRSVLVVDSDPHSRRELASLCMSTGWEVRTADRCAGVLAPHSVPAPDYLFVEESLADGSAYSLFRRLRDLNPRLQAVMLSRSPTIPQAVLAIRMGFRDYRSRPIDRASLQDLFNENGESMAPKNDVGAAKMSLARAQWKHIRSVLTDTGGNVSAAARILGLHRRSLQRKLSRRAAER
jgi:two-component system response regulator RegA